MPDAAVAESARDYWFSPWIGGGGGSGAGNIGDASKEERNARKRCHRRAGQTDLGFLPVPKLAPPSPTTIGTGEQEPRRPDLAGREPKRGENH